MQLTRLTKLAAGAAVLGLAFTFNASAQVCPDQTAIPWSDVREDVNGMLDIVSPGLAGTNCALDVGLGSSRAERARVQDTSPVCESSYRARLYMDTTDMPAQLATTSRVKFWNVQCNPNSGSTCTNPGVTGVIQFRYQGLNSGNGLFSFVRDQGSRRQFPVPLSNGENWVELQWIASSSPAAADGQLRVWVNANAETDSPVVEFTDIVTGTDCIDQTNIGVIAPTTTMLSEAAAARVQFDEFESRRQTFIGQ